MVLVVFNSVGGLRSARIYFEFVGLLIWMLGSLVLRLLLVVGLFSGCGWVWCNNECYCGLRLGWCLRCIILLLLWGLFVVIYMAW